MIAQYGPLGFSLAHQELDMCLREKARVGRVNVNACYTGPEGTLHRFETSSVQHVSSQVKPNIKDLDWQHPGIGDGDRGGRVKCERDREGSE